MIIPVASDNIEDHASEQFYLLRMRMCEHATKFDEFLVFKVGAGRRRTINCMMLRHFRESTLIQNVSIKEALLPGK